MKKAAKTILNELNTDNKEKAMFHIDKSLHSKFKKICSDNNVRMSNVVEKLIENFVEEVSNGKS